MVMITIPQSQGAPCQSGALLRTPARSATSVAFQAGTVAHKCEVPAFTAGVTLVPLGPGLTYSLKCSLEHVIMRQSLRCCGWCRSLGSNGYLALRRASRHICFSDVWSLYSNTARNHSKF